MNVKIGLLLVITLILFSRAEAQDLEFFKGAKGNRNFCQLEETLNKTTLNASQSYSGKIDYVVVSKIYQKAYLFLGKKLIRIYPVVFGKNPIGPKQFEGDLKTPEGLYFIVDKNPESKYHKSLQISYPTKDQMDFAQSQGKLPGVEIMFHGLPNPKEHESTAQFFKRIGTEKAQAMGINWTKGCMAMNNENIEEMYSLVTPKTLVEICPSQ